MLSEYVRLLFVQCCVRAEEVTLKDVQSVIGQRTKCCYHFQTQRSDYGIARKEVTNRNVDD